VLREQDVPREQLLASSGGERHRLADGVTVAVYPSLHSCTWCAGTTELDQELRGHQGLTEDERAKVGGLLAEIQRAANVGDDQAQELRQHISSAIGSFSSGGPLVYLIETPAGSIFYQDSSGCWSGVLAGLRPDVAILAAAGRGNLDGEPFEGTLAQFVAHEAGLLDPETVVIGHHDNWLPPITGDTPDLAPVRRELAKVATRAELLEIGYLAGTTLLG
jgi:hypothetical protein